MPRRVRRSSRLANQPQLLQGCHAIIQPNLLGDLAVFDSKNRGFREVHFASRRGRQRTDEKVADLKVKFCDAREMLAVPVARSAPFLRWL